jgi:hypothetical protein
MIRHCLIVVLVTCCGVLYLSSSGFAAPSQGPQALSAKEATGLAQEENISLTQAERDLQIQQQGINVGSELEKVLGDGYAGVWFDPQSGRFHVDLAPSTDKTTAETILTKAGIAASSEFNQVHFTWGQLEDSGKALNKQYSLLAKNQQAAIIPDPITNSIIVKLAANVPSATIEQIKSNTLTNAVPILVRPVQPDSLKITAAACEFPQCDLPVRGGVKIFSTPAEGTYYICTAGFDVKDKNEYPYILTAGHCFYPEGTPQFSNKWATANAENTIGYFLGYRIASEVGPHGDAGVIETREIASEPDIVISDLSKETENVPVSKSPKTIVGEYECHVGQTSDFQCGTVKAVNVSTYINYSSEGFGVIDVEHTDTICMLTLPGDSGGPVFLLKYNPLRAYGSSITTASNSKNCSEEGSSTEYELSFALEHIGVHLP